MKAKWKLLEADPNAFAGPIMDSVNGSITTMNAFVIYFWKERVSTITMHICASTGKNRKSQECLAGSWCRHEFDKKLTDNIAQSQYPTVIASIISSYCVEW